MLTGGSCTRRLTHDVVENVEHILNDPHVANQIRLAEHWLCKWAGRFANRRNTLRMNERLISTLFHWNEWKLAECWLCAFREWKSRSWSEKSDEIPRGREMADRKKWKYATKKSVTGTPSSLPKVLHDSTANFGPWRENWPLFWKWKWVLCCHLWSTGVVKDFRRFISIKII